MLTLYRFFFFHFGSWLVRDLMLRSGLRVGQQHPFIPPASVPEHLERLTS